MKLILPKTPAGYRRREFDSADKPQTIFTSCLGFSVSVLQPGHGVVCFGSVAAKSQHLLNSGPVKLTAAKFVCSEKNNPSDITSARSYLLKWCPDPESNQRHEDFQSSALPTELSGHILY